MFCSLSFVHRESWCIAEIVLQAACLDHERYKMPEEMGSGQAQA